MATATIDQPGVLTYGPVYPVWPERGSLAWVSLLTSTNEATDPWQRVLERVQSFAGLTDDWDGEGSIAPSRELVKTAVDLANRLRHQQMPPPSRVAAGPDGTVLLEWQQQGQGGVIYFEIEVCAPGVAESMLVIPGQPTRHDKFVGW
jgi:hypothetical protein